LKKEIITYCACPSEDTSARAAQTLRKHGVDARALVGGYHKWLQVEGRAKR
jgi:rhodanese-related sulfurtransferase